MDKKIFISIILVTRKRVNLLKENIRLVYERAAYPDNIEYFIGIDNDDNETLDFIKTDEIFKKYKGIRVFSGPRVGHHNCYLFFREFLLLCKGEIIVPMADDLHIRKKGWDEIALKYKNEAVVLGWRARMAFTRKAIEKYDCVRDYFQKKHIRKIDSNLWKKAHKEGFYRVIAQRWAVNNRFLETEKSRKERNWRLKDLSILNNFKLKEIKIEK